MVAAWSWDLEQLRNLLGHAFELLQVLQHFDEMLRVLFEECLEPLRVLQRHFQLVLLLDIQAQIVQQHQSLLLRQQHQLCVLIGLTVVSERHHPQRILTHNRLLPKVQRLSLQLQDLLLRIERCKLALVGGVDARPLV